MPEDKLKTPGVAALIIGICLIIATVVGVAGLYEVRGLSDSLSVTGSAEKVIISDVVKWRSSFSRTVALSAIASGYADMKRDLLSIESYLKTSGITESEIVINPVVVNQVYSSNGYGPTGNIVGYTLQQDVVIESKDVDRTVKVAKDSSVLISKGILFSSMPVEYYYSKLADVKIEILAEAMENAKLRAEQIAKSGDAKIRKLKSASMGVIQITAPNSPDVSDYGFYDTSSKEKKVSAVVKAAFTLK